MATEYAFGQIVTSGLVLSLNAADRNSYPGSGTSWRDMSGNGINGTLVNGPTFNSANGGSIVYDGTDDSTTFASNSVINFLNVDPFTIEIWGNLQTLQAGARMMVSRENSIVVGRDGYNLILANMTESTVQFSAERFASNVQTGANAFLATSLVLQKWGQFLSTYDGNFYRMYFNGVLQSTSIQITSNITNTTTTLAVGSRSNGFNNINMAISSVKMYNRALSASEVAQNYNAQKSRFGL
jgi:hypothetical protein